VPSDDYNRWKTQGYNVLHKIVPGKLIYELAYYKSDFDYPRRGHDVNGTYYPHNVPDVDWGNYWTDPLNDNQNVKEIADILEKYLSEYIGPIVLYHADCSVLTNRCSVVRPHVDTPHRHAPWQQNQEDLAIQVAIPMSQFDKDAGSTAFLPNSHNQLWDIQKCYRGEYTAEFLRGAVQPRVDFTDAVIWNSRTLHSQMPNISSARRYMLLLNFLRRDVVEDVMDYEASLFS